MQTPELVRAAQALQALIDNAVTQGLEKLPAERELADQLGVSRNMVRRALEILENEGAVVRSQGRSGGAFITAVTESAPVSSTLFDAHERKLERDLNAIKGIPQMLAEQGFEASTRVLSESVEDASPGIARALGLTAGAPVISLLRLRLADGRPLSLERMFLDADVFPDLLTYSPIGSLYALLATHYGVTVTTAEEHVEVVQASRQVADLLDVKPWAPVLALRRVSRRADGSPVEASIDLFRPELTRLIVRTVVG
ncbi:GntR family transcriptional regulator [Microbacterium sp. NPDC077663]|uniref:GntR family transcriptional regulator n=1 Tax=Microbacterium sp. NPDC077663 TaxID=3364189 RepID=UPI0037C7846F